MILQKYARVPSLWFTPTTINDKDNYDTPDVDHCRTARSATGRPRRDGANPRGLRRVHKRSGRINLTGRALSTRECRNVSAVPVQCLGRLGAVVGPRRLRAHHGDRRRPGHGCEPGREDRGDHGRQHVRELPAHRMDRRYGRQPQQRGHADGCVAVGLELLTDRLHRIRDRWLGQLHYHRQRSHDGDARGHCRGHRGGWREDLHGDAGPGPGVG